MHDDIIVTAETTEEHIKRIHDVLTLCSSNGIHLNAPKCKFFQLKVKFLGFEIDVEGLHKTKEKVKAVLEAPIPTTVTEVKSFMGLVNFYVKFCPNIATVAHPLYELTKKDSSLTWTPECEKAFQLVKEEIASERVLVHYSPDLPITLAVDASPIGLGAVLSHTIDGIERPIAFASRILSATEKHYSQIDKEALAIKWGVEKFFHYLYARRFTLITDH